MLQNSYQLYVVDNCWSLEILSGRITTQKSIIVGNPTLSLFILLWMLTFGLVSNGFTPYKDLIAIELNNTARKKWIKKWTIKITGLWDFWHVKSLRWLRTDHFRCISPKTVSNYFAFQKKTKQKNHSEWQTHFPIFYFSKICFLFSMEH